MCYIYCICKSVLGVLLVMAGFGFHRTAYSLFLEKQVNFCVFMHACSRERGSYYLNQYAQFGLTPDKIGIVFLSSAVPYTAIAPLSGLLADKFVSQLNSMHNDLAIMSMASCFIYKILQSPRFVAVCGLLTSGIGYLLVGPTPIIPVKPYGNSYSIMV